MCTFISNLKSAKYRRLYIFELLQRIETNGLPNLLMKPIR